jgi:DNA polymerase sigma
MNVFIKWWAKSVGIIGASDGFLSSYALTLMIIAFLQNRETPVLPCLQQRLLRNQKKQLVYYPVSVEEGGNSKKSRYQKTPKAVELYNTDAFFEKDLKVIEQHYMPKEKNTKSVAELIYEFFYFYVYTFDTDN